MNQVRYLVINVIHTLLRLLPWPRKPGMIEIGRPDRGSPVLLTCNFRLTVERVARALQGLDCYLLAADSHGVNVWCAASGGLLTHHDVVAALKTSGIETRVDHRTVILPQLAAAGIQATAVQQRAGWDVLWGPVEASELPAFLEKMHSPSSEMRQVRFGWQDRLEMGVAWAFPISLLVAVVLFFAWRPALAPALFLCWGLSLAVLLAFPLYGRWLRAASKRGAWLDRAGLPVALWAVCMIGLVVYGALAETLSWAWLWRWAVLSGVVVLLVTLDLPGMTPVLKSGMHRERRFRVALDLGRCTGEGVCAQVCPRGCFEVEEVATMPGAMRCIQCGACVVQCPEDALALVGPEGEVVSPEDLRRHNLNLMGGRV